MRRLKYASVPLIAVASMMACSSSDHGGAQVLDSPDASTGSTKPSKIAAARVPHTFDNLSPELRERIFEMMEHQGAVASGLHPDFDPDRVEGAERGRKPFAIGSTDISVNGLTEQATQSETSVAINTAGTILIAGYNDATGFPASGTTLSLSGVARSSDGGNTWAPVLVGPGGAGTLPTITNGGVFGDPDIKYDPTRDVFYYASIFVAPPVPPATAGVQGMSIHVSNSGATAGTTWTGPLQVTPTFITGHSADKEFIDVNTRTGRLLMSWTDFGPSSVGIMSTFSDDGGATWSTAAPVSSVPGLSDVQSSIPRFLPAATNAASTAYVAWRHGVGLTNPRNVGCSRSTDGGATWSTPVDLDNAGFPAEDFMPGIDRIATSPSMAVDYTTSKVYVVYQHNDARGGGDIALRTFTGACAAGAPVLLSSNPGNDRAQFMPWVTVDQSTGFVHVIWYDQGHHATGDVMEVMRTMSKDQGVTWSRPTPLVDRPFHAGFGNDTGQPNMGDYIQAVAQGGKLHSIFGATSVEPKYSEGLPSGSLISPDSYYDQRLDATNVAPLRLTGTTFAETNCVTGSNGNIDPGETISLTATVQNYVTNAVVGAGNIGGITGTLTTSTAGVTVTTAAGTWADLAAGASGTSAAPMAFSVASSFVAGTPIDFVLTMNTGTSAIQLPFRLSTGTPGTATAALNEDFEAVTVPALPAGWSSVVGAPAGAVDPWVSTTAFAPFPTTSKFAFHAENAAGTSTEFIRLFSPAVPLASPAGPSYVTLDFDIAYRLQDETTQRFTAYDGLTVRLTDSTGGTLLRSVLAEAFAQQLKTGNIDHFPKHTPRSGNANYFQDMSVWSGDSQGIQHISMRFPGAGMVGRTVQLRFEYTQDATGTCTDNGYAAPCGVAIDNIKLAVVPLNNGSCNPVCGNGVVEGGEQCDDGAANGTATDCCSATCTFDANTAVCRPAAAGGCDVAESCTGSAASCPADVKQPNGTVCTGGTCQAGICTPATDGGVADAGVDSGVDAGVDSGVDAGVDSGVDAGVDSGVDSGVDAGNPIPDAGVDSGNPIPDAGVDSGNPIADAGKPKDSGTTPSDSGSTDGAADAAVGGTGDDSGCGCKVAGATASDRTAYLAAPGALGGIMFLGLRLRRRRRSQ